MRSKKKNTTLVLISVTALFVMLTLATACWQTADPATSPNEEAQASAHQGGASSTEKQAAPDQSGEPEVQTTSELEEYLAEHADVSIFDVMDEDTARLFSELPSGLAKTNVSKDGSSSRWTCRRTTGRRFSHGWSITSTTCTLSRTETRRLRRKPPDGAQNETNWLPESVRMLSLGVPRYLPSPTRRAVGAQVPSPQVRGDRVNRLGEAESVLRGAVPHPHAGAWT